VQCNQSEESRGGEVQSIRRIKRREKCNAIKLIKRGRSAMQSEEPNGREETKL